MAKNNKKANINTRKCQTLGFADIPCRRPLYDNKHCIFHSEDIERKKEKYNDEFWKEFERQMEINNQYDFTGFVFPESISFKGKEFDKNVYFSEAKFAGGWIDFSEARFSGVTDFSEAQFSSKRADFSEAQFAGKRADFSEARFSGVADFNDAQFSAEVTNFSGAQFSGDLTQFNDAQFSAGRTDFNGVQFTGVIDFNGAQFVGVIDFSEAQFSGVTDFSEAQFSSEANFYLANFKNVYGIFESFRKIKKILFFKFRKNLVKDWRFYIKEETALRYPLSKRRVDDAWYLADFKDKHPIIYFIWWLFADCGRSIFRWAAWSLFFALAFGLIFYSIFSANPLAFKFNALNTTPSFWSFIYYSVVTFTTLGFGDIVPTQEWVQRWVMAEVILGYIMLGGLISIFANKLARRS